MILLLVNPEMRQRWCTQQGIECVLPPALSPLQEAALPHLAHLNRAQNFSGGLSSDPRPDTGLSPKERIQRLQEQQRQQMQQFQEQQQRQMEQLEGNLTVTGENNQSPAAPPSYEDAVHH